MLFSCSAMSNSLKLHGLQHVRFPCPSISPRVSSNSCPLSQQWHLAILSSHPLLLPPSIFSSIRVFPNELAFRIRLPKYWSFSFSTSPSNEYSGLISFRIDWLDLLAVQRTLKSPSVAPQLKIINSSVLSLLYGPTLTCVHDYWRNHSFDYMDHCRYSDVSVY